MANVCIVDFQGFQVNPGEFIVKELAVMHGLQQKYAHFIFLPPSNIYPSSSITHFVENHHHGLKWNSGYVPYYKLQNVLNFVTKDYCEVYVKGHKKLVDLKFLLKHKKIINLEAFGCPSLNFLKQMSEVLKFSGIQNNNVKCFFHTNDVFCCSLLNVMMLSGWFQKNICS